MARSRASWTEFIAEYARRFGKLLDGWWFDGASTNPVLRATLRANLLVPVYLSASHIAYGSIRMEPVFLVLGESAAFAAAQALALKRPVQDVSYRGLRKALAQANQILEWTPPSGWHPVRAY